MERNKHVAIHAKELAEKRLLKKDYVGAKAMALKAKKLLPLDNLSQLLAVCEVHQQFTFWTKCPGCEYRHQYHRNFLSQEVCCTHCSKNFVANALSHLKPGRINGGQSPQQITETNSAHSSSGNLDSANKCWAQQQPQPQPHLGITLRTECPNCGTLLQYHSDISYQIVCCTHCSKSFSASAASHLKEQVEPSGLLENINTYFKLSGSVEDNGATSNKARVEVNGVPNGNGSANATNTSASTCVEGEVKKQDRQKEKDSKQVEPNALLKKMDTAFHQSESAEENITTYKKARVEVNGGPDGNGSANTSASTCVDGEMREQDREKLKGIEQLKPSGFLKEKDTAFKSSASDEGSGATYKKAKLEVNGVPDGNGSASATNTNTSASTCAEVEVKEQDEEKEKEQVATSGLLEKGNTAFKQSGSAEDNCATSKKASLEVERVQDSNGSADTANTSASTILERKVKEQYRGTARIFADNALPHLNPGNQPQQFTGQQQPQQSDSYRFTYVRRVRGTSRNNAGGFRKPNKNCLRMSKSNNPITINGQRAKSVSADTRQMTYPCFEPDLSVDIYQRSGNAEGTGGGNHAAGTSRPLWRYSRNKPDVKYKGTGVSNPAKKARGEVKGERNGNSPATSKRLRRSSRYKPDLKSNGTCVSSPAKKPNDDAEKLYVYPDPEFHKFEMCRTCNKFQQGNIWALYSDLDTFPKYYGLISKVEHEPFKVHINWLKACPKSDVERAWLGASLPISCGKFWVTTQNTFYDKPEFFSHIVSARHHVRGNYFDILPGVGEIWAVYKNWSARWTCSDFKTCKFDIVEIREQREDSTMVWPLRQVPEFKSVFMPEQDDGTGSGTYKVPASAYILFSHKIPAVRLTDECGGKLKGFWELDPASVP